MFNNFVLCCHFIKWRKINTLSCSLIISINFCKTTTRYNYHLIIQVTIKNVCTNVWVYFTLWPYLLVGEEWAISLPSYPVLSWHIRELSQLKQVDRRAHWSYSYIYSHSMDDKTSTFFLKMKPFQNWNKFCFYKNKYTIFLFLTSSYSLLKGKTWIEQQRKP